MTPHIAIIGAGIIGVSTALYLRRDGYDVTLIDREGPAAGASFGNGGVLASCSCVPVTGPGLIRKAPRMLLSPDQPLFLKWGYLPQLLPWLVKYLSHANAADTARIASAVAPLVADSLAEHQALAERTTAARYIVPADYLYLYKDKAAFDADRFAWDLRRENGIVWDTFDRAALHAYDPSFGKEFGFAVRMGDHGRISDPGAYVTALANAFQALGGRLIQAEVQDILREGGEVRGLRLDGDTLPCTHAVLTAGAYSSPLARKLGLRVPLETERGYHLELWEPSITPRAPVMVASGKFVITPMEGRLRLAGIVELGGLAAPPSAHPFALLRKNVTRAMPGLTWSREKEWMGHRPAPADSIPVLGAVPGATGAFVGFGHHHIGMTAGPKTGRLLSQLIAGRTPNIDLAPYSPARYTPGTDRTKNQGVSA